MTVPVVVLTGFLGAGKTTLVNRLLARGKMGRVGVIVNELGEIGIDGALLDGTSARQVELPGGCVCCTIGDDLERTLLEMVEVNPGLRAILLETTGVAEPIPIAWAIDRAPCNAKLRCAAVVTLVDADNFVASRAASTATDAQVAYADVVLVTKHSLDATARAAVRGLAPRAEIRDGTTGDHAAWLEQLLDEPDLERIGVVGEVHVHDEHCDHAGDTHGIASVAIEIAGVVDLEELEEQLAALPAGYVRIKGIARAVDPRTGVATAGTWIAVHRVGLRVSSEPVRPPDGWNTGKLVALGRDLDVHALEACVAASELPR